MRTWTLVTDAIAPGGRREAFALAARGKDLILLGDARGLLEEVAAELRVVHRVDVRTFVIDLTDADAADRVLGWIDARELALDGVVAVRGDADDDARAARTNRQITALEERSRSAARGFGGVRRVSDSIPPGAPSRERRSVVPPGSSPPAARPRTSTARGHRDPSMPPDP